MMILLNKFITRLNATLLWALSYKDLENSEKISLFGIVNKPKFLSAVSHHINFGGYADLIYVCKYHSEPVDVSNSHRVGPNTFSSLLTTPKISRAV